MRILRTNIYIYIYIAFLSLLSLDSKLYSCCANYVGIYDVGIQGTQTTGAIAFSPINNCLAIANYTDNTVSLFSVNPTTNALMFLIALNVELGSSPTALGESPISVAFSSDGDYLAVANSNGGPGGSGNVIVFDLSNWASCAPPTNPPSSSTYAVFDSINSGAGLIDNPYSVTFVPDTDYLVVVNKGFNNVVSFLDPTDPTSSVSNITVGTSPVSLAVSSVESSGSYCLAVANSVSNSMSTLSVDPSTATITSVGSVSTDSSPNQVAFSPDGSCLVSVNSSSISLVAIASSNCAALGSSINIPDTNSPSSLAFNSQTATLCSSVLAYTDFSSNSVNIATVSGCTSLINAQTISGFANPFAIAFTPTGNGFAVVNDNNGASSAGTVMMYNLSSTLNTPSVLAAAYSAGNVAVMGSGVNPGATITIYADGIQIGTCTAYTAADYPTNTPGNFSCTVTPSPALTPGTHAITVTQTSGLCISGLSNSIFVTPGLSPVITSVIPNCDDSLTVNGYGYEYDSTATIYYYSGGTYIAIGSGPTDSNGNFSIRTISLAPGAYSIVAATSGSGFSSPITVILANS